MKCIKKVKLHNYRRFSDFEVQLDPKLNILIGENEAGKSSILSAINLVLSGSRSQFDKVGAERLLNTLAVEQFLSTGKKYEDLPKMYVELWLSEQGNFELNGNQNSENIMHDGLRIDCIPIEELVATHSTILLVPDLI